MKNQKGVSMITLIITIIVIIILAAIAFVGMDDATGGAQFSGFAQEFGDYQLNFKSTPVGNLKEKYAVEGVALTDAQYYKLAASLGATTPVTPEDIAGDIVPAGVTFGSMGGTKDATTGVVTAAKGNITSLAATDICYLIENDSKVANGYKASEKFYGDNLGTEKHYVSQYGVVFTVPGFPRTVDGESRMYITPSEYYVVAGTDTIASVTATASAGAVEVQ